jgi:hypothetical protein
MKQQTSSSSSSTHQSWEDSYSLPATLYHYDVEELSIGMAAILLFSTCSRVRAARSDSLVIAVDSSLVHRVLNTGAFSPSAHPLRGNMEPHGKRALRMPPNTNNRLRIG